MNELRIYLDRHSLRDDDDRCAWAALDAQGVKQAESERLDDIPAAAVRGRCHVILAGDRAVSLDAPLPDLPPRRLLPLLPGIVEGLTLEEAEQWHVRLLDQGGARRVLAVQRPWLTRCLDRLAARGLRPRWAAPETLLLPVQADAWSLLLQPDGSLLRTPQGDALALDRGAPPAGLGLALERLPRPQRLRLYRTPATPSPDPARWHPGPAVEDAGVWDWRSAPLAPPAADLLSGLPRNYGPGLDPRTLVRPLLWGLAALALVQFLGLGVHWGLLAREEAALQDEIRQLAARALPAGASVVDPMWQVEETLARLKAANGEGGGVLGNRLGRLGRAWPTQGAPRVAALQADSAGLDLTLAGAAPAWVDQFTAAAGKEGLRIIPGRKEADLLSSRSPGRSKDDLAPTGGGSGGFPEPGAQITLRITEGARHGR